MATRTPRPTTTTSSTRATATRKHGAGTSTDPIVVLAHGKRRADQSYALAIGIGAGIAIVGLAAIAAWLHWVRDVDLTFIARNIAAPGGIGVGLLSLAGWMLRERLAPQQAGVQREVAAVKVELEKARAARDAEQAVDRAEITELKATVGRLIGVTDQLVTSQSKTSDAVIGQRRGIDEATSAALGATAAVVQLQRVLLEAAQAGAKRREEAEQAPPPPAAPSPAEVEEERSAKVRAAGQRLREAREDAERRAQQAAAEAAAAHQAALEQEAASAQAAGASWLDTGDVTTTPAQPLTALSAPAPAARTVHYPDRIITPLDPEWVPPRTGTMPVVPPKTDPNVSTAVHQWFHTGRWPTDFDPDRTEQ